MALPYPVGRSPLSLKMYGPNAPAATSVIPPLEVAQRSCDTCGRDAGSCDRIPDPDRVVVAGGGQPAAVRGDRHRLHAVGVAPEGAASGAGVRIPDPNRAVVAGGGQPAAVRGDRHRLHAAGVAGEGVRWVPVTGSQIRTVPSSPPVASQLPSGRSPPPARCRCGR
jgi:hypothetical protein